MKRRISTPKKVALVVLGALTILTLVNLIEASVKKYNGAEHAFHVEGEIEDHIQGDIDFDGHVDIDIHVDEQDFEFNFEEDKIVIKKQIEAIKRQKESIKKQAEMHIAFNGRASGDLVKEKSFDVTKGELVSVDVQDANVIVHTHDQDVAHVAIYLNGQDMRKAQAYFENQNFKISHDGSAVYVRANPEKKNSSWDMSGGAEITIELNIPSAFDADIRTSDGNVIMSELEGEVSLHSSDGDIVTKSILGSTVSIRTSDGDIQTTALQADDIHIQTSDGDISVEDLSAKELMIRTSDGDIKGNSIQGQAAISTSDGDINLTSIEGNELNLRTSDGEIFIDHLTSNTSKLQTSDGSIVLRAASGDVTAKTSSGDVRVSLDKATNVYLRTNEGNIYVDAPSSYAASIRIKADNVQLADGFGFSGEILENSADGTINGGGFDFEARTTNGKVIFREN